MRSALDGSIRAVTGVLCLGALLALPGGAAALTDTDVEPATLAAGATGTATVTFTTGLSIPVSGEILITFPAGFELDTPAASVGSCSFDGVLDGGFVTSLAGQTLTIARDGTGLATLVGSTETCTITNVRNPQVSGGTGVYTIKTQTALGITLDGPTNVAEDTIVANTLSSTSVTLSETKAGASGTASVAFTTFNPVPADGQVVVVFPAGFDLSGVGAGDGTCSFSGVADGGFATSVAGQTVTITRDGAGALSVGGSAESCTIAGVVNPSVSGDAGGFSLSTTDALDAAIDEATGVDATDITANLLTAVDVEPADLKAGATSTVTASFTLTNPLPLDGKVVIVFPSGFDVSGASGSCASLDGDVVTSVVGQAVSLARDGLGTVEPAGAQTCTITGVRNPQVSGSTGAYTVRTTDAVDAVIDEASAAGDTLTANVLSSAAVSLADSRAGATGTVTAAFTTTNPIPADGRIEIVFPAGFDLSGVGAGSCTFSGVADGGFATAVAGQTVSLTRDGAGAASVGASAESCTVPGLVNPDVSGDPGAYVVRTTDGLSAAIDALTGIDGTDVTTNLLAATDVEPASLVAGETSTVTVSFTQTNPLPADGQVVVVFPAGFDVSGAAGSCASMGGDVATTVAAQTVSLTRDGLGAVEPGGSAQTCTITGVRNPQVSGSAGAYTLRIATAAGVGIDEDGGVGADAMDAGALSATDVEPDGLFTGEANSVTLSFTTANPLPADGKVEVTFPAGFDVSGASGGTCGSMDGGFATAVAGQVVTLTRDGAGTAEPAGAQTCTLSGIVNPADEGAAGTYTLRTRDAADAAIDEDPGVAADTFSDRPSGGGGGGGSREPVDITATASLAPATVEPGTAQTYTFRFEEVAVGRVTFFVFTFPEGFDVASASCTMDAPEQVVGSVSVATQTRFECDVGRLGYWMQDDPVELRVAGVTAGDASGTVDVEIHTWRPDHRADALLPLRVEVPAPEPVPEPADGDVEDMGGADGAGPDVEEQTGAPAPADEVVPGWGWSLVLVLLLRRW